MLTWLLLSTLAFATPPPLPDEAPPRIRGMAQLYVTPDAFVSGLTPASGPPEATPGAPEEAPANPLVIIRLRDDSPLTLDELAAHLASQDGMEAEVVDGAVRVRPGTTAEALGAMEVPAGDGQRSVNSLGTLQAIPVPTPRLPGPLPAPPLGETGYDLNIYSPIIGMRVEVEVEGTVIGELGSFQLATLRDVRPGAYRVVFISPTGHRENTVVDAAPRSAPSSKKKGKKARDAKNEAPKAE